jgi:hypothetical protein
VLNIAYSRLLASVYSRYVFTPLLHYRSFLHTDQLLAIQAVGLAARLKKLNLVAESLSCSCRTASELATSLTELQSEPRTYLSSYLATNVSIMSFGFAVGDFIAVGKLIKDITACLQSVGGAKSDYQELIREFKALDAALRYLDRLESGASASLTLQSIKCAALLCRHPLEEFLAKARRYDDSLGIWDRSKKVKQATDKFRWTFGRSEDIQPLQTYLNIHVGTINMLLAEHGFERLDIINKRVEEDFVHFRYQLDLTHALLENVDKSLPAQAHLLRNVHSMVTGLYTLVCGEMKTSLQHLSQVVSKVW